MIFSALVADDGDAECTFNESSNRPTSPSSLSLMEEEEETDTDLFNFAVYMDQVSGLRETNQHLLKLKLRLKAPLTIQTNSPLELAQQLFSKLGAKYVVVTDPSGFCKCCYMRKVQAV